MGRTKKSRGKVVHSRRALEPHAGSITRPRSEVDPALDWGGVQIVNPPSAMVSRLLPGRTGRATPVEMDLRSFVPSKASAVVKRWISDRVEAKILAEPLLSGAGAVGRIASFDTIAHLVADLVFDEIPYQLRDGSAWQLPEETLARGSGDCEDRATLLASSLVAAGVSPYNVRVALGTVSVKGKGPRAQRHSHAWVVYRAEDGYWSLLEPVPNQKASPHARLSFGYDPDYVFNGDHQWSMIPNHDIRKMKRRWNALDPRFHGEVHKSIVEHAAQLANLPDPIRTRFSRTFTVLFGNVIDRPDLRFRDYDPRDHFDSGLIDASWSRALDRLERFYEGPISDSDGINNACWALHAISDFYAHSSYAHFLESERGRSVQSYDPRTNQPALAYQYGTDPVFSTAQLSHYDRWWQPSDFDRLASWQGKPISGRYSFSNDSEDSIERLTNVPPADAFPTEAARNRAGALPHHDEIAVDEAGADKSNKIYPPGRYAAQFSLRYALALQHVTSALAAHPALSR